jgi:deazaflavin-dependent oxidoreductase (nitroreductase family)
VAGWNESVIEQFRANNGKTDRFGNRLVIIHSVGAKTGEERLNPVLGISKGDGWLVIASKGGSPENPGWYFNLKAHPDVTIEAVIDGAIQKVEVTATEVDDAGYADAWAPFVATGPGFVGYAEKTQGRRMPIFELTPR